MDTNEILTALRAMREEYSPVGQSTDRNDRSMPDNDWAEYQGRDEGRDEIRNEVCRDLARLIAQITGDVDENDDSCRPLWHKIG